MAKLASPHRAVQRAYRSPVALFLTCCLSGCGGGGGGSSAPIAPISNVINVNVSGLTGQGLVLQNNAGDNLTITADGTATFHTPIATGKPYEITVLSQPSTPSQGCYIASNSGTMTSGPVTLDVTCHVRGQFAYAVNAGDGTISGFSVDATTGALTPLAGPPTRVGKATQLTAAAMHPSGQFLYVADGSFNNLIYAFSINQSSGALTAAGSYNAPSICYMLSFDNPGSHLYENCGSDVFQYDVHEGDGSLYTPNQPIGTVDPHSYSYALAPGRAVPNGGLSLVANNHLYVGDGANNVIDAFSIDPSDGWLTSGVPGFPWSAGQLGPFAADPGGATLFVTEFGPAPGTANVGAYRISSATGALTAVNSISVPASGGILTDMAGKFLFIPLSSTAGTFIATYAIDPTSGAIASQVTGSPVATSDVIWTISVEPRNRFAYAIQSAGTNFVVAGFTITTSGALAAMPGPPVSAGNLPTWILFN